MIALARFLPYNAYVIQVGGSKGVLSKTVSEQNTGQMSFLFYMFKASGLDFRVQYNPVKHLVPSHTCKSEHEHSLSPQYRGR